MGMGRERECGQKKKSGGAGGRERKGEEGKINKDPSMFVLENNFEDK